MKHPIANNKNIYFYLLAWLFIILLHASYMHWGLGLTLWVALADSLLFNDFLCGLGLSYWYMVRYTKIEGQPTVTPILVHVVAIIITVGMSLWASQFIAQLLIADNATYQALLGQALPWRFFSASAYMLILTLVYYLIRYYHGLKDKLQNEAKLATMVKEAELDMLKSQINPHFIFNSLNSVSALAVVDPEKARDMVIQLSSFLRYSLGKDSQEKNTLEEEVGHILLYLAIEKIRFGDRLHIDTHVPETCKTATLPNMILQPIFENAIKYGVYETLEAVNIRFEASLEPGYLILRTSNSFDPTGTPRKGKGIGLKNIAERLRLVYGQNSGLLTTQIQGTTFFTTLKIPQNASL